MSATPTDPKKYIHLKKHIDLVIFDWAGTVVDFGCEAPVQALQQAFAAEGLTLDETTARCGMGMAKADHVRSILAAPEIVSAWRRSHGRAPEIADIEPIMGRLQPLMRRHAAMASTLIPGVRDCFDGLRAAQIRVASSTGYTRDMLEPVLAAAASQGYVPEHVLCAGETLAGRPSPLMIYKACVELGVWPVSRVVKVDDAEVGIAEGKAAGAFTVGVATGNTLGLSRSAFDNLSSAERHARIASARQALLAAGADLAIASVADLLPALSQALP